MTISVCQSLNYTTARLPNRYGHQTMEEADAVANTFYPLIAVKLLLETGYQYSKILPPPPHLRFLVNTSVSSHSSLCHACLDCVE